MIPNSKNNSGAKTLKGVSTLDSFNTLRSIAAVLFLILLMFGGKIFAQGTSPEQQLGHSTLDLVDPTFNAQISTSNYNAKSVNVILPLPDGKILVGGRFNSYNGAATGSVVRVNADGSLDTTFIGGAIEGTTKSQVIGVAALAIQPDGKILVGGAFQVNGETATRTLARLNADGSLDNTFSFNVETHQYGVRRILVRQNGKIVISSDSFSTPNGIEGVIQLNADGSLDSSFNSAADAGVKYIEFQNGKLLVLFGSTTEIARLNEDGSFDGTFNRRAIDIDFLYIQPEGKIIGQRAYGSLVRLNADGTSDATFIGSQGSVIRRAALQSDGKIIILLQGFASLSYSVLRLHPNGAYDASFTSLFNPNNETRELNAVAVQADGKVLIGEENSMFTTPTNLFMRANANGARDSSFVTGTGFQLFSEGSVGGFAVQPNNKILIGGRFDLVNSVSRYCLARLNEDGTLDNSFQISTTAQNRFISIAEIHNLALQSDGKVIVSGSFSYIINGATKNNLVRLHTDGSIDASYNLSVRVDNYAIPNGAGRNKVIIRSNNKALIGTSRNSFLIYTLTPLLLNEDGSRDTGFNPTHRNEAGVFDIHDLFVQPDNKIVIGGRYQIGGEITKSILARLNADGSLDSTFQTSEEENKVVKAFALLDDGKILVARATQTFPQSNGEIVRLNSDGTRDPTFKSGAVTGKLNALLSFADGKILVGGAFTKIGDQSRRNLAVLNADGSLDPTLLNVNQEVLSLTLDNQGRVLAGGAFTTISTGSGNVTRSYMARLLSEPVNSSAPPRFDFDGDGRSDLALFNEAGGIWTIRSSRTNQTVSTHFGTNGDITAPADYDNDGKTDIAVYRPAEGMWYLQQSTAGFKAVRWGAAEDKPVAADYDGDGRTDIAVFRPGSRIWYILQSSNNQLRAVNFGLATDVLLREADFDGDGKADIAVYRPSTGGWYWQASGSSDEFRAAQWGASADIPVAADYNGDGKTDIAVYRPSDGVWYQQLSTESGNYNFAAVQFGLNGDVPVVADYNGDGKADVSIRRGEIWALLLSAQGYNGLNFGNASDKAVAAVQQ
ncbi:MAG TPA: FG-GAP-like repeat-containing protein [Pyrinomonadaceae bacterium]